MIEVPDDKLHDYVSSHACLRYLKRALGIDVGEDCEGAELENYRLTVVCRGLGITPAQVRRAILTPDTLAAMKAGARTHKRKDCVVVFSTPRQKHEKRFVITIYYAGRNGWTDGYGEKE